MKQNEKNNTMKRTKRRRRRRRGIASTTWGMRRKTCKKQVEKVVCCALIDLCPRDLWDCWVTALQPLSAGVQIGSCSSGLVGAGREI